MSYKTGLCFLVVLLVVLVGCGPTTTTTQTLKTERHIMQLALDGTGLGERVATIDIKTLADQPIPNGEVVVLPSMEQMSMESPEVTAQQVAPGRYEARGEFFTMLGEWELSVRVHTEEGQDAATFKVRATP